MNGTHDGEKTHTWNPKILIGVASMAHRLLCHHKYTWSAASSIGGVPDIWCTATLDDLSFLFRIAVDRCDGKQMTYDP